MPQLGLGQLRDKKFQGEAWLLFMCCFSTYLPPCQRGGNAALIYHSSALTIWSRSDDPHLAPLASSTPPLPQPLPFSLTCSCLYLPSLFLCLAHQWICSIPISVSLSFLARSALVFCFSLLSLPAITVTFWWWKCFELFPTAMTFFKWLSLIVLVSFIHFCFFFRLS